MPNQRAGQELIFYPNTDRGSVAQRSGDKAAGSGLPGFVPDCMMSHEWTLKDFLSFAFIC